MLLSRLSVLNKHRQYCNVPSTTSQTPEIKALRMCSFNSSNRATSPQLNYTPSSRQSTRCGLRLESTQISPCTMSLMRFLTWSTPRCAWFYWDQTLDTLMRCRCHAFVHTSFKTGAANLCPHRLLVDQKSEKMHYTQKMFCCAVIYLQCTWHTIWMMASTLGKCALVMDCTSMDCTCKAMCGVVNSPTHIVNKGQVKSCVILIHGY